MEVCADHGISHSNFLGGPPRWTQADRDKALWRHVRAKTRCGGCGTRAEEWDETQGGSRRAYAGMTYRCLGCEQMQQAQASVAAADGKGIHITLERNHDAGR